VPPMVGGKAVSTAQIDADACRYRFLADRYVKRPGDFTCFMGSKCSLFEGANTRHRAVMVNEAAQIISSVAHFTGRQLACVVACSVIHLGLAMYTIQNAICPRAIRVQPPRD
jgi:hypothetical protein